MANAAAATFEDVTIDFYRLKLAPLARQHCDPKLIPDSIQITSSPEFGAAAFMEQVRQDSLDHIPRIGLQRGLVELSAALAYFHIRGTKHTWLEALQIMHYKAKSPTGSIRARPTPEDWQEQAWKLKHWEEAFLARISFYIAHELGHHCLKHTVGGGLEVADLYDADGKPLKWQVAFGATASHTIKTSRDLETNADEWAVKVLFASRTQLGLGDDEEFILSGPAELALLDAAMGRIHTEQSANSWTHPLELVRFDAILSLAVAAVSADDLFPLASYVRSLHNAAACIRHLADPLGSLQGFIDRKLFCPGISESKPALDAFLAAAAPPLDTTAIASVFSVTSKNVGDMKILARRVEDPSQANRRLSTVGSTLGPATTLWQVALDPNQQYVLQTTDAPKSGEVVLHIGSRVVGTGVLKEGKFTSAKASNDRIEMSVSKGELIFNIAQGAP